VDLETIPWVDVVPIDAVGGDPFPPISLAVRQLESGGVLGIRHRWQPQPLYDIWGKMDLEWFPQRIGPDEWYIFVHRPASVPAFPTKPVIGAEIGKIPRAEVLPRLQVLAEQLAPGQVLEATGLAGQPLSEVCAALEPRLGPSYLVEAAPPSANRPTLRVTHRSG
jgi:hypothetical protein